MKKTIYKIFTLSVKELSESGKLSGMLLLLFTIISIGITNTFGGESYINFFQKKFGFDFFSKTIEHWVNDGLMAVFFFLIGLEIKREILVGELSNVKSAMLPVIAAIGGVLFPAMIFYSFNSGTEYINGWAIPTATDIAFSLGILALLGDKVPYSLKIFLTALAIIDDLIAILIIAFIYTSSLNMMYLYSALLIFSVLILLSKYKVKNLNIYYLLGVVLWFLILESGVHATIAGVMLALTIPLNSIEKIEHSIHKPVNYFILPIFALVNTAILIDSAAIKELSSSLSLGIILGLFIGKAAGITLFSFLADKLKIGKIPGDVKMLQLLSVGFVAGIGFTMSIFITNLSFDNSLFINESKLAVLLGSLISALTGALLFLAISGKRHINN